MKQLLSAAVLFVALCQALPARAAWTDLGTFSASGSSWLARSGTTGNGLLVSFELTSDLPECGPSGVFYEPTTALVEYDETIVGGTTTALAVRFSYSSGIDTSHWRNVAASGLVLCTPVAPLLANGTPDLGGACGM